MQNLPAETIDLIVSFIERKDLSRYSCLSTHFESAIERRIYNSIDLKSTELDSFTQAFSNSRRRAILSNLVYQVILPEYDHRYYNRYERDFDRKANNKVYTKAIQSLFQLLSIWHDQCDSPHSANSSNPRGLSLEIRAYSPSDKFYRSDEDEEIRLASPHVYSDLEDRRYRRSFLQVLELESIPAIPLVKSFTILTWETCFGRGVRLVEPSTVTGLAGLMPSLDRIEWTFPDNEKYKQFAETRQERRYNFAQSLSKLTLNNLTHFQLQFGYLEPMNHGWQPHSALSSSHPQVDHFSLALHNMTQAPNLRVLHLQCYICLSPVFFWPTSAIERVGSASSEGTTVRQPFWPFLQEFCIDLSAVSPDGSWLFDAPPQGPEEPRPDTPHYDSRGNSPNSNASDNSNVADSYNDNQEDHMTGAQPCWLFRTQVRHAQFALWIKSMARATQCMPKLKTGTLCMNLSADRNDAFVEVQCRVAKEETAGREWEIQLGFDSGEPVDTELIDFLEDSMGRKGGVKINYLAWASLGYESRI